MLKLLIANLKKLNTYLQISHFKMESIASVKDVIQENDWMGKIDLQDVLSKGPQDRPGTNDCDKRDKNHAGSSSKIPGSELIFSNVKGRKIDCLSRQIQTLGQSMAGFYPLQQQVSIRQRRRLQRSTWLKRSRGGWPP